MGNCVNLKSKKIEKKTISKSEKENTETDFSKNITRSSSSNFLTYFKYLCTYQNKIYQCDCHNLENKTNFICNCEIRKDKSINNLKNHEENLDWGYCFKHTKIKEQFYCFECEICLCEECIKGFHENYFKDHHLFIHPKI